MNKSIHNTMSDKHKAFERKVQHGLKLLASSESLNRESNLRNYLLSFPKLSPFSIHKREVDSLIQ